MNERLFRRMIVLLMHEAEEQRDNARLEDAPNTGDMWSAIAGHLDNARQRLRR